MFLLIFSTCLALALYPVFGKPAPETDYKKRS